MIEALGMIAGFFSTISLVPQLLEVYKKRSGEGVSSLMLGAFALAAIFWIIYGTLIDSMSVLLTNIVFLVCSVLMLFLKYYYNKKNTRN